MSDRLPPRTDHADRRPPATGFARPRWPAAPQARLRLGAMLLAAADPLLADPTPDRPLPDALEPVVVTATRGERALFDLPTAVSAMQADAIGLAGPGIDLSEALVGQPGVAVLNRQNYAQDLQVQSRGFGARAPFGVRGIRLYVDGIPASMPDGQGQTAGFPLDALARLEALRGPFSALWGNAAGGVIQGFTTTGSEQPQLRLGLTAGGKGLRRQALQVSGPAGEWRVRADLAHFETEGAREHAAAQRSQLHAKLTRQIDPSRRLSIVLDSQQLPEAQDPLGLTRTQFEARPQQAAPAALQFDTRKRVGNDQAGIVYEHRLGRDELRLMGYAGTRQTRQFQAIPVGAQAADTAPGGVIDLARRYHGLDARMTWKRQLGGTPTRLSLGLSLDRMREHRRGYENFLGSSLGVQGALRRDEDNRASNADLYAQGAWAMSEHWTLHGGLRHSSVRMRSHDRYISGTNGDDSGAVRYRATTPMLAAVWHASQELNVYASWGHSFETPTLNEVAYQPDGRAGLNAQIDPARGRHLELGLKARTADGWRVELAAFHVRTRNEIGVLTNAGGRSAFQNVGATRRTGAELALTWQPTTQWRLQAAYTHLLAHYLDDFRTCTGTPCRLDAGTNVAQVPAGQRLPGVARRTLSAEIGWQPSPSWQSALELSHVASLPVNDLNTDSAPAYTVWNLRLAWQVQRGPWQWRVLTRLDNLLDRTYAGSVIVNEANSRYFEAAPGRRALLAVQARYAFAPP